MPFAPYVLRTFGFLVLLILPPLLSAAALSAADVKLSWDPIHDSRVAGVHIYAGPKGTNYTDVPSKTIPDPSQTSCTVDGLEYGTTYAFTATSYDNLGNESDFSNIVYHTPSEGSSDTSTASSAISDLSPSDYETAALQKGMAHYLDRTYTIAALPAELQQGGERIIRTENDDKDSTVTDFLSFTLSEQATVYVAYDPRADSLPSWLRDHFEATGLSVDISGDPMGHFDLYRRTVEAGEVVLGGNMADGASGAEGNYVVVVRPTGSSDNTSGGLEITELSPFDYRTADLVDDMQYYLDRTYTIAALPAELQQGGERIIRTENDDKANTSSNFLSFTLGEQATVYVGYDPRAASLPDWLRNGFADTGASIDVSGDPMGYFKVYATQANAGEMSLGGNMANGASGASSNYIVIVQP